MAKDTAPKQSLKSAAQKAQSRDKRLKAALKENMARRKAQAKARGGAGTDKNPQGQNKDEA